MHNRLDSIPACDGRTDRQTNSRQTILRRHSPRYAYASRGKNRTPTIIHSFIAIRRAHYVEKSNQRRWYDNIGLNFANSQYLLVIYGYRYIIQCSVYVSCLRYKVFKLASNRLRDTSGMKRPKQRILKKPDPCDRYFDITWSNVLLFK